MDVKAWVPTLLAKRQATAKEPRRPRLRRTHRSRRPGHVTTAKTGTREILWALPRMGGGWHNRYTGRKPDGPEEVGCPHITDLSSRYRPVSLLPIAKGFMRPKGTTIQLEVRRRVAVSLLEAGWGVRRVA